MRRMSNIKHGRLLAVLVLLAVCLVPAAAWAKTINIEIEKVKYFPATGEGATIRLYKIGESSGKAPTSFSLRWFRLSTICRNSLKRPLQTTAKCRILFRP